MRFKFPLKLNSLVLVSSVLPVLCFSAHAADFTITNGQTVTATQTIGAGANETGTLEDGGTISTTGNSNSAITSTSASGTIINGGTITTTGDSSYGVNIGFLTHNNTINNNGSIFTTGANAYGIYSFVTSNVTITNTSSIDTDGAGSTAIYARGDDGTVSNTGSITTDGDNAIGVFFFGNDNVLINNGTITTNGDNAQGVLSNAASDNVITNNGTIIANGVSSHGIQINGSDNTIINNGTVIANGSGAALRVSNISGTIINQGYAQSVGGNAIELSATDSTLTIKPGSWINGRVLFDGGGDRILQYDVSGTGRAGGILAITGTITGTPTTSIINTGTLASDYRVVQSGDIVAVITPDQFGTSQQIITQTLNDIDNVLNNRQQLIALGDTTEVNADTRYATSTAVLSDDSNPNDWAIRDRNIAWAEVFGSYQKRGQTSDTSQSKVRAGGFIVGIDLPQTTDGLDTGFYVGGFGGNLDVGSFRDIDSRGVIAGGHIGKSYDKYYLSGGLNIGYSKNDSRRLTGVDTARSDYASYFASPSVTIMRPIDKDGFTLVPNFTLRYVVQHDSSYTETGAVANQSVDARNTHALDAKAMVEARMAPLQLKDNTTLKSTFRGGVRGHTVIGGDETDINVLGNTLSFDPKGNDHTVDGILGVNLNLSQSENFNLYFDAEANMGLNHGGPSENKGSTGRIGMKWQF